MGKIDRLKISTLGRICLFGEHQDYLGLPIITSAIVAKINGSGGGGCMFAYALQEPEIILDAVKKISNNAFIVYSDEGTCEEKSEVVK